MRLGDAVMDLRGADPRAKGAGKGAAEPTSDPKAVPFGDVLSDVGSGPTSAVAGPLTKKGDDASIAQDHAAAKPTENGITMKVSLPQVVNAQTYAGSTRPADMKGAASDTVDDLIGRLSRGAAQAASVIPASNPTPKVTLIDDTGESDRTTNDKPKKADAPNDLVAMLLAAPAGTALAAATPASSNPTDVAQPVAPGSTSKEVQTSDAPALQNDNLEAPASRPLDTMSLVADASPTVTEISISTHLAPAAVSSLKAGSTDDFRAAAPLPDQRPAARLTAEVNSGSTSRPIAAESISSEIAGASNVATPATATSATSAKKSLAPKSSGNAKPPTDTVRQDRSDPSSPEALHEGGDTKASPVEFASSNSDGTSARQHDAQQADPTKTRTEPIEGGIALEAPRPASVSAAVSKVAAAVAQLAEANTPPAVAASPTVPARTLTLQMNQADVGPIAVRMHLTGRDLNLQLTVSNQGTLADLSRDRGALVSALGDHHYQIHSLVIQDGAGGQVSGGNNVGSGDTGSGARSDAQGTGDRNGGGRNDNQQPRTPRGDGRSGQASPPRAGGSRRSDSLFV